MFATLMTILITALLVVGGAGGTVYAAQDSQPNDFLYPVKTLSEDVRLDRATQPESQMQLALQFANRRADEMAALVSAGQAIPAAVYNRWLAEVDLSMELAAELDDNDLQGALLHIERNLRDQDRVMGMTQAGAPDHANPVMEQARALLQNQIRLAQTGQEDPLAYRRQFRPNEGGPAEPGFGPGQISGTVPCPDCTPALGPGEPGYGPGEPGHGIISGTLPCEDCARPWAPANRVTARANRGTASSRTLFHAMDAPRPWTAAANRRRATVDRGMAQANPPPTLTPNQPPRPPSTLSRTRIRPPRPSPTPAARTVGVVAAAVAAEVTPAVAAGPNRTRAVPPPAVATPDRWLAKDL